MHPNLPCQSRSQNKQKPTSNQHLPLSERETSTYRAYLFAAWPSLHIKPHNFSSQFLKSLQPALIIVILFPCCDTGALGLSVIKVLEKLVMVPPQSGRFFEFVIYFDCRDGCFAIQHPPQHLDLVLVEIFSWFAMIEILEDLPQYVAFRDQVRLEHCRVCNAIPSMCSHISVLDDDCILVRDAVSE